MAHHHDHTSHDPETRPVVRYTDVIDALVAPVPLENPTRPTTRVHLRAIDPGDHGLPSHHDTVVHDVVLMEDFAGELRRWLAGDPR